jgi:type I restriction enzyme S subunit
MNPANRNEVPRIQFSNLFCLPPRNGIYKPRKYQGRGIKLVKMSQLFSTNFINSSGTSFDRIELTQKEKDNLLLKSGDLLFSRTSVVAEGVGKCSYVRSISEELTYDSNMIRIRLDNNIACQLYYFYYFNSPTGRSQVISISSGAAVTTISGTKLSSLHVPYPSLPIQRKIAAILSIYDDLIENNTRRIQILEEMAQAIYRQWFVEYKFPGHEDVPLVDSGTELGEIPQGWGVKRLGDLAESVRRNIKPGQLEQKSLYFGLEHLPRKSIALNQWDVVDDVGSTKLAFRRGEILFGKIRPYFHKVGVAPLDGIGSSDIIVIRPKKSGFFGLVLEVVSSERFVEHSTLTSQGTKMPRANWDVLVEYPVAFPSRGLLERHNRFMQDTVELIRNYIFKNANLRATRDLLLPRLVSGEVDVSQLEIQ